MVVVLSALSLIASFVLAAIRHGVDRVAPLQNIRKVELLNRGSSLGTSCYLWTGVDASGYS